MHYGRTEVIGFIDKHFPSKKVTTNSLHAALERAHRQKYQEDIPIPKKRISAMLCSMVTGGYLKRIQEKDPESNLQLYIRTEKQIPADKMQPRIYVQADEVLHVLKEEFPNGKIFNIKEVIRLNRFEGSLSTQLKTLAFRRDIEQMPKRGKRGQILFRLAKKHWTIEVSDATENPPTSAQDTTENLEAPPPEIKDQPKEQQVAKGYPDLPPESIVTEEFLSAMNIPLSLVGKALFLRMQEMVRIINGLQDELTKERNESSRLKDRISQQFRQIQSLNQQVTTLNTDAQGRQRFSQDKLARLGDIARITTLKRH